MSKHKHTWHFIRDYFNYVEHYMEALFFCDCGLCKRVEIRNE